MTGVPAASTREAARLLLEATDVVILFGNTLTNLLRVGGETRPEALAQA